jgi:hypothetical protein
VGLELRVAGQAAALQQGHRLVVDDTDHLREDRRSNCLHWAQGLQLVRLHGSA